jgi:hypothetical protein
MISVATGLGFQYMIPLNKIPQEYGKWFNVNDVFGLLHHPFLGMSTEQCVFVAINEKRVQRHMHIRVSQHLLIR